MSEKHLPSPGQSLSVPAREDQQLLKEKSLTKVTEVRCFSHDESIDIGENIASRGGVYLEGSAESQRKPLWLRFWILILCSFLASSLWISLLGLWHHSEIHNGLQISLTSNHLAWTYGPTAILVVVVSFWRQIDYNCKSSQAWRVMSDGYAPASKTVLLDYVWPLQIHSFVKAIRYKHYAVVLSIASFGLLKFVTLASTGLLVSEQTYISALTPITYTNKFDGTQFWQTAYAFKDEHRQLGGWPTFGNLSYDAIFDYIKVIKDNSSRNDLEHFAFQYFAQQDTSQVLVDLTATVDIFVPMLQCEIAALEREEGSENDGNLNLVMSSPTCPSWKGNENHKDSKGIPLQLQPDIPASGQSSTTTTYSQGRINCSQSGDSGTDLAYFDNSTPYDLRMAFYVANVTTSSSGPTGTNDTNVGYSVHQAVAVVCKVDYQMIRSRIVHDLHNDSYTFAANHDNITTGHLSDLSAPGLLEVLLSLLYYDDTYFHDWPVVTVMQELLGSADLLTEILDGSTLQQLYSTSLAGLSSQFMRTSYLVNINSTGTAEAGHQENRLQVKRVALLVMVIGLALVSLFTFVLAFIHRSLRVSAPTHLAKNAAILASSDSFRKSLEPLGRAASKQFKAAFSGIEFRTLHDGSLRIEASADYASPELVETTHNGWRPYPGQWHAILLAMILPLLAIVALELLSQFSDANNGLLTISNKASTEVDVIRYSSTLVMLGIATLFNSMDFTIAIMTPFSHLKAGCDAQRGLFTNLAQHLAPVALARSIRHRFWGVSASNLAAVVGSLLTIAVSGLWTVDSTVTHFEAQGQRRSTWSSNWQNSSDNDRGAAQIFNSVQHGIQSPSSNIWQDLVLADLQNVRSKDPDLWESAAVLPNSNYTFEVPALRPVLLCELAPMQNVIYDYDSSGRQTKMHTWMQLPDVCVQGSGSDTTILNISTEVSQYLQSPAWFGTFLDVHVGRWTDAEPSYKFGETSLPDNAIDNPLGCPSVGVQYGVLEEDADGLLKVSEFTALFCYQKLQQVPTTVTFVGDPYEMIIDKAQPPRANEVKAQFLTNGTRDSFPYRLQAHFENSLQKFRVPNQLTPDFWPDNFDPFFNFLLYGPSGVDKESLAGPDNVQQLADAVGKLYQDYMTTAIDLNLRNSIAGGSEVDPSENTSDLEGSMMINVSRLSISKSSKLALQIMLALMMVFGASAHLTISIEGVLPRNPCSIASTMSLLAASEICKRDFMPVGAEWFSEKRLLEVFKGYVFSIGWWHRQSGISASKSSTIHQVTELQLEDADAIEPVHSHPEVSGHLINHHSIRYLRGTRFAIDIGLADRLGFDLKNETGLRRRFTFRKA